MAHSTIRPIPEIFDRASNLETEPQRAPYAEAAEADPMGTTPLGEDESKQRT